MFGNKKIVKIGLVAFLFIIAISVIISISSNVTQKPISQENSKTNTEIDNVKEKEYYDFIDTNDFTLKLTEQETLTLVAEAFDKNISQFKKASDSTSTEKFYMLDGTVDKISIKITLLNGKTKRISFSYISLVNKKSYEDIGKMEDALIQRLIYVATNRANPEDIGNLPLDTNVKGLHTRLNSESNYGCSVSIEVEE